jgi:hypothetical protein
VAYNRKFDKNRTKMLVLHRNYEIKEESRKKDKFEWICMNIKCDRYQTTKSIREGSFFEKFASDFEVIFGVFVYLCADLQNVIF